MSIVLHGSYFGYNFGDTLLCRLFCEAIQRFSPDEPIVLPLANARNATLIGAQRRGLPASMSARAAVYCGGGYFSQPAGDGRAWSARAMFRHVLLAEALLRRNVPLAILGVGAGPLKEPWLARRVATIFDRAAVVVVRDEESRTFLQEIGVERPLPVAIDAALYVRPPLGSSAAAGERRRLLLHTNVQPSERELNIVRSALRWAEAQDGIDIVLAVDGLPRRRPSVWAERLRSESAAAERIEVFAYDGEPNSMLELIASASAVVTTKLHVGIVSVAYGKFVVSVPVHSKTPRLYRQMGLEQNCIYGEEEMLPSLLERLEFWRDGGKLSFATRDRLVSSFSYDEEIRVFLQGASDRGVA